MDTNSEKHNIPDWNEYFIKLLPLIASRSKDKHTKTGCLIITPNNNIVSTGYNSFPRGIDDNIPERLERPEKYKWIEHADRNAIYAAAKKGVSLDGCIMYLTGIPCIDCSRAIIQSGIIEVIYDADNQEKWEKTATKYNDDWGVAKTLLQEGGVKLTPFKRNINKETIKVEVEFDNSVENMYNTLLSILKRQKIEPPKDLLNCSKMEISEIMAEELLYLALEKLKLVSYDETLESEPELQIFPNLKIKSVKAK